MEKERSVVSSQRIKEWFKDFEMYLQEKRVLRLLSVLYNPHRLFNADESGFAVGGRLRDRILAVKHIPELKEF